MKSVPIYPHSAPVLQAHQGKVRYSTVLSLLTLEYLCQTFLVKTDEAVEVCSHLTILVIEQV